MYEHNQTQQEWLESLIVELGGSAGTVHVSQGGDLYLTAACNIPPAVIAVVAHVPHGKGMAGIAQTTKTPVQTCNLQTDSTGRIKPGAKAVGAQAAVAAPVLNAAGEVRAVVGIAWDRERKIGPDEEKAIMKLAAALPEERRTR
jgi:L-methionine (R)-S-oxide reductase